MKKKKNEHLNDAEKFMAGPRPGRLELPLITHDEITKIEYHPLLKIIQSFLNKVDKLNKKERGEIIDLLELLCFPPKITIRSDPRKFTLPDLLKQTPKKKPGHKS